MIELPMAQKPHEPTEVIRAQVHAMAAVGTKHEDIAEYLCIGLKTLRKYYDDTLKVARTSANTKVAQNLFRIATGDSKGAVAAAIFWLKVRAQWKEARDPDDKGGVAPPTIIVQFAQDGRAIVQDVDDEPSEH